MPTPRMTLSYRLPAAASSKLCLMCSYGSHIVPCPHEKSLCYVSGDTRIVVVDRNTSLSDSKLWAGKDEERRCGLMPNACQFY
ncbi:hypothetical protein K1719_033565 [Acacia pycnantha]|nr:hypothetical protein K1719_033565 [Acacia pycnantha]